MDSSGRGEASRIAESCGVSREMIRQVISGERPASLGLADKISKATGGAVDSRSVLEHYYIEVTLQVPRSMLKGLRDGDVVRTRVKDVSREEGKDE